VSGPEAADGGARLGDALRAAAGGAAVAEIGPPAALAGALLEWRVEPTDVGALAGALAALDAAACPALVRGGGTRLASGPACPRARVLLSTRGLTGVLDFERDEGVIQVAAGTTLLDVVDALEGTVWELPLDAPGDDATVGGVLAAAADGPRRVGFGPVRHQVLGLEVVLADGTRTRCGGRVVKNVTGYDLAKLHVGAEGAFGVIASAWLRLRARPEARRTLALPFDDVRSAVAAARSAARLPSARMATLLSGDLAARVSGLVERGSAWVLALELAGSRSLCERDGAALLRTPRASERPFSVDAVGAVMQHEDGHALQARISLLPSELAGVLDALYSAGLSLATHPEPGLVEACLDSARGGDVEAALRALRALAPRVSGRIGVTHRALVDAEAGRGRGGRGPRESWLLGADEGERGLLRALKQRFDPRGVLNPGRLAEPQPTASQAAAERAPVEAGPAAEEP